MVQPPYPSLDEHAQKRGEEDETEADKEERVDSNGVGRWGELWGNVWLRCAVLHDACLVEENILDRVEWVGLQEADGLDEKSGQNGGKKCGLDYRIESVR